MKYFCIWNQERILKLKVVHSVSKLFLQYINKQLYQVCSFPEYWIHILSTSLVRLGISVKKKTLTIEWRVLSVYR